MNNILFKRATYICMLLLLITAGCYESSRNNIPTSTTPSVSFPQTPVISTSSTFVVNQVPTFTSTPTSAPISTPTKPSTLQAQWLTLPASTISAENVSSIKFQKKLGIPGIAALSPNGQFLALATYSKVILYDFKTLKEIMRYDYATDPGKTQFTDIQFSPDSKYLAGVSNNIIKGSLQIWNTSDGSLQSSIKDLDWLYSLSYSPDGSILAVGSAGGLIILLETEHYQVVQHWEAHSWIVDDIAFSPDGTLLASVSRDNTFRVWRTSDGNRLYTASGKNDDPNLEAGLSSVAYSPNGNYIAIGSDYGFIGLYKVSNGTTVNLIKEWKADDTGSVNAVAFFSNGSMLASGSYSGVAFWSIPDFSLIKKIKQTTGWLKISSDGTLLIIGNQFWTVK